MSLMHRVRELINSNEMIFDRNEGRIDLYMSQRWPGAFRVTAQAEGVEYDESFPPATINVADLGENEISNQDEFIAELEMVIRRLSNGERLERGEFQ